MLLAAAVLPACSAENPANDFCTSYGDAMRGVVAAAHGGDPAAFSAAYKSTMDALPGIRAKAPDDTLRSAFDRSMFTFSVFGTDANLASFLSRVNFSDDAVITACNDYGVNIHV